MDDVAVLRDRRFAGADGADLVMDLYRPAPAADRARLPVVVIVAGYPDPGFQKFAGCRFKDMMSSVSWARLLAASGIAAVTYTNREPVADAGAVIRHVQSHAGEFGLDGGRMGLWASSGNVPLALSLLLDSTRDDLKCAALCYGFMFDDAASHAVEETSRQFGFVCPAARAAVEDLPPALPLYIARAGRDHFPGLNDTIDRFVPRALASNLPITVVNHPVGPHAFDLFDDSETTRHIVRQLLAFLQAHLGVQDA
jgi:acetyl esterase/lipase